MPRIKGLPGSAVFRIDGYGQLLLINARIEFIGSCGLACCALKWDSAPLCGLVIVPTEPSCLAN